MRTIFNLGHNWRLMETPPGEGSPGAGPAAPASGEPAAGDDSLFSDLAVHEEVEPVPEPAPATPAEPPVSTPAAATPPAAPAPAAPAPSPAAPAAPAAPAQPPGSPAAGGGQQPPASGAAAPSSGAPAGDQPPAAPTPEQMQQHMDKMVPELAKLYAVDEADVEALRTEPEKVLPTLAGRLHYGIQMAVFQGVMSALPQMMEQYGQQQKAYQENENAFFEAFPDLKAKPEYAQTVLESIKAVRATAPNLSREDLIKRAGILACTTLGIVPGAAAAQPGTPAQPAAPSAVPAQRPAGGARPPGVGATSHIPAPVAPGEQPETSVLDDLVEAHLQGLI